MNRAMLEKELSAVNAAYEEGKGKGLKLNISRGVPSLEQLDLSMPMLDVLHSKVDYYSEDGIDTRNYGCLTGLPEAKLLMAEVMETKPANVIVFCDSSLNIMFDLISKAMTHGIMGSTPWAKLDKVKFLCPVPGYDRHFAITEYFGIEMINIPMTDDGPDMDLVESYVNSDASVKGIWCVPKYSNPTGTVYSDETVRRFAALSPAASDFRIFWDNAYNVHHLDMNHMHVIPELISECQKAGHPDMVYKFGSFSKITFAGSSIAALATSEANIADVTSQMKIQTIGHSKINQLRHVRFFPSVHAVMQHMAKHAAILKPKFDMVDRILNEELSEAGIFDWTKPDGGYFVSFNACPGTAKAVSAYVKEAGVTMTPAGATYPHGVDPEDMNLRIAPSAASLEDLEQAMRLFTLSVKKAALEKLLTSCGE